VTKLQADLLTLAACVAIIVAATHWSNYRPGSAVSPAPTHASVAGPIDTIRNAERLVANANVMVEKIKPTLDALDVGVRAFAEELHKNQKAGATQ
jgi:hypothetical protein